MYLRTRTWAIISVMCFLAAAFFWRLGNERAARHQPKATQAGQTNAQLPALAVSTGAVAQAGRPAVGFIDTNAPFKYRLSNTRAPLAELIHSDTAVLLRNALIDSSAGVALPIPEHLRVQGETRSYIVQSRGTITDQFRDQLQAAGAEIVSYVPNNAYLVRVSAAGAAQLGALAGTQSVTPWEPYFKLAPTLLELAVEQRPLPDGNPMVVMAFPGDVEISERALRDLGATVMKKEASPFGTQFVIYTPPDKLISVVQLDSVQAIEPAYRRGLANDLARTRVGISTNTITSENHLGLTGQGIKIGINDTGVDENHPELLGRVFGDSAATLVDFDGHGTHVAGIAASAGNPANAPRGPVPGSTNAASFRGMAPQAQIFAQPIDIIAGPLKSDTELQETAATNDVFISNNSWGYVAAFDYTFAAASWDAAVRDSVRGLPGSQAMTYVFSAGNVGFGGDNGGGGFQNTVHAPGTAKNVITVGATEQFRNITNEVVANGQTNMPFAARTDSDDQVAHFSSRGNVGPGIEGPFGRFKPDVVAPGAFLVSTRASGWAANLNVNVSVGRAQGEVILVGQTNIYFFAAGPQATEARIRVIPNGRSPVPFPTNSIYVRRGSPPPPSDYFANTNQITVPVVNGVYYFGVGNNFNQDLHCDIQIVVISPRPPTPADQELIALNANLEDHYRYESGTSMAAPVVSGMLALMQQRLKTAGNTNPSPALMKALLINGARSMLDYDLQVDKTRNAQGWGIANITNSLPLYSASVPNPQQWPVRFFDQGTNVLVTGQSYTRKVTINTNADDLRISLVWTDPPGNPSVGSKLVNDLDLIVTNLNTLNRPNGPEVFVGNLIPIDEDFSAPFTETNLVTDVVNNVENVLIRNPRAGTEYSVTVRARRVNVNAVTAHAPTGIAQDYALVISSGNPASAPVFTISAPAQPTPGFDRTREIVSLTNGVPIARTTVGANPPFYSVPNTNGFTNQWRFFVFENTNTVVNTNVGFFAFLTPNLSQPRTSRSADIDLYVSTNPGLTNLNPGIVGSAATSRKRGGTEAVVFSNATARFYYIGVKSEDQQAATFGLFGFAGPTPFSERDSNGVVRLNLVPIPATLNDGNSETAAGVRLIGVTPYEVEIRNVVVTNTMTHSNGGDLIGILEHTDDVTGIRGRSVLNNHRDFVGQTTFIWDDSDSGNILEALPTDPPGTLRNFWGTQGQGIWELTMVDDSLVDEGTVDDFTLTLHPRINTNDTQIVATILANRWFYTFVDVPANANLLGIDVATVSGAPVELYARHRFIPDQATFDHFALFGGGAGTMEITRADSPPLRPGIYFIGLRNPNSSPLTVNMRIRLEFDPFGAVTNIYRSTGTMDLLDDAVTTALLSVTNFQPVYDVRVGVRIEHARASDLVLTLVSPGGTRVLLSENRGGDSAMGYGGDTVPPTGTNIYTIFTDSTNLTMTPIKFGLPPFTNSPCPISSNPPAVTGQAVLDNGFEGSTPCNTVVVQGQYVSGWLVESGDIDVGCVNAHSGTTLINLNGFQDGIISTNLTTAPNQDYRLTFAYCKNPQTGIPNYAATLNVEMGGQVLRSIRYDLPNSTANFNWLTTSIVFRATSATTTFRMVSTQGGGNGGMYLDSFNVVPVTSQPPSDCNYFFPEEALTQIRNENAFGVWRLEILDNRVGAPIGKLVSWELDFDLGSTNPPAITLTNGQCYVGTVAGSNDVYFRVRVPLSAGYGTNDLTSLTGNDLRLGASVRSLPVGMQPPDAYPPVLASDPNPLIISTNDTPPLPQGQWYYLVVENFNPSTTNDFQICVTFDNDDTNDLSSVIALTNACYTTNITGVTNVPHYFSFDVSTNAIAVIFEIINNDGNVDLVVNRGLPLPNLQGQGQPPTPFPGSRNPGNQPEYLGITNFNFGLDGRWYIGVFNLTNQNVNYTVCAREVAGVRYTDLTLFPCTNAVVIPPGAVQYFQYTLSPLAMRAHFTVSNILNGNIDMFVTEAPPFPPPSDSNFLLAGINPGTSNELEALSLASNPALVPGSTYYIAITNLSALTNRYSFCVYQFIGYTPLADGICTRSSLLHSNDANYFRFTVNSNSVRADFMTFAADGNVDMYLSRFDPPGPNFFEHDYNGGEWPGTISESISVTTNSSPVPLAPGDWYVLVVNRDPGRVNYCLQATQTGAPNISQIGCTNVNTLDAYAVQYFEYTVSPNALRVVFQITNIVGDVGANVDMYVGAYPTIEFPGPSLALDQSTNPGAADEFIALSRASGLNPPITYRIAVTNLDITDVSYHLCVIETTNYIALANDVCFSNRLDTTGRRDAQYYSFNVANNAVQLELSTLSAADVDVYLRRVPIPGRSAGEFDYAGATPGNGNELIVVTTNSPVAPLAPGLWYAVVTANNLGLVDYCIKATQRVVEDLTSMRCTNSSIAAGDVQYYQYTVSSNAFSVEFEAAPIPPPAGNINMYINAYPPLVLPGEGRADAQSANTPGSVIERIVLSTGSAPQLQAPGTYFIAITNAGGQTEQFRLCITETTNAVALTNAICLTNTIDAAGTDYFQVTIFSNSLRADFMTFDANGNVDLYVRRLPPPGPTPALRDYWSENSGTTNEVIVVDQNSMPVALSPGEWYIAVVNRESAPVTYCLKVTQYPVLNPFNIALRLTNGPAYMDFGWNAFDFQRFHLEWTPHLNPVIPWQPFRDMGGNPVEFGPFGGSGTNFYYRDQPLTTNRFYRLRILP